MEVTVKQLKIQQAKKDILKVLERQGLTGDDLVRHWYDPVHDDLADGQKAFEKLRGIWKNKKGPDPVKWQRKIRKEWDRKIL